LVSFGAESGVFQVAIKSLKIQNIQNYNCACFLYGCKTWSLTLREKRRLMMFENKVLRRIFRPRRVRYEGSGEKYIMRSLMIRTPHPILFG